MELSYGYSNSFLICTNTISCAEVIGCLRLVVTLSMQIQLVEAIHVDKGWCACGGDWCLGGQILTTWMIFFCRILSKCYSP